MEAYQRGYEDAMRAAGEAAPATATEPARATARRGSMAGGRMRYSLGYAFGWLILFPLFFALTGGILSVLFGGTFILGAAVMGGITFAFALFAGASILGFRLFVRFWPLVILAIVGIVIVRQLLD